MIAIFTMWDMTLALVLSFKKVKSQLERVNPQFKL
jgi:hypothetical protein